jgi:putative DNA primase/helicase
MGADTYEIEYTDWGMLERFTRQHAADFAYVEAWGKWAHWNGSYWDDASGAAQFQQALISVAQAVETNEGLFCTDFLSLQRFARKYRSNTAIKAVRQLAEQDMRYRRSVRDFDSSPWLLNCLNGTLDLRTGELFEPRREDFITRRVPVRWSEDATCPKWEQFLTLIFRNDRALIDFVWRALGYSLTGDKSEQVFFVCYGEGANGKSTLLEVMRQMMGEYARTAATGAFQEQLKGSSHTDNLAALNGSRLIIASETGESVRLDEALIKSLTGERSMMVARKYESFWEMSLTGKIWMLTNHRPEIRGQDNGIWRRVIQIPFDYIIPESQRIRGYEDVLLREESEGILAWCVRGLHDYLERGELFVPEAVGEATQKYRDEMDILKPFLEIRCELGSGMSEMAGSLYNAYLKFCETSAVKPVSQTTFGRRLHGHGCRKRHTMRGIEWQNISLKFSPYE